MHVKVLCHWLHHVEMALVQSAFDTCQAAWPRHALHGLVLPVQHTAGESVPQCPVSSAAAWQGAICHSGSLALATAVGHSKAQAPGAQLIVWLPAWKLCYAQASMHKHYTVYYTVPVPGSNQDPLVQPAGDLTALLPLMTVCNACSV